MTGFFEALRVELVPTGVSVTLAYPGVVATEIRYRGFNAKGEAAGKSGLDESGAMSAETCARLIVDGTEARSRDIVMTTKGKLGRWIKLLAPGVVDKLALKALNQHARPQ
jgi:short-subunit dehydrogenase